MSVQGKILYNKFFMESHMKIYKIFLSLVLVVVSVHGGISNCFATDVKNSVSFVGVKDGDKVKSPVKVKMEVTGKKVALAGDITPDTGHFHIIIDAGPVEQGKIIIADVQHLHFGKGQTEAEVKLEHGHHTLTLQFADGMHVAYGKEFTQTINVVVE